MGTPSSDLKSRDLIAGIAIITLCCAVAAYFPVFGFFSFLILPLPAMFYRIKLGRRNGGVIAMVPLAIMAAVTGGWQPDLWLMLGMIGQGFVLGECVEQHFSIEKSIAWATATVLMAAFFLLTVMGNFAGTGGWELLSAFIRKNLEMTATVYRQLDVPAEKIRMLTESLDRIHYVLLRLLPALMAAGLMFSAWMNLLLGRITLRANRLPTPAFGRLNTWQAPEWLVWAVIAAGLMAFLPVEWIKFPGANALIVLMMVYLFQGLAIISYYFNKKQVPLVLRVMIYAIIALQQILMIFVIGLGFFDTWINFRRLGVKDQAPPPST